MDHHDLFCHGLQVAFLNHTDKATTLFTKIDALHCESRQVKTQQINKMKVQNTNQTFTLV